MSPHKSYNKCKLITKLYFTSFDAKAKYWSEQHASWEQLISFTDDKKTSCTLLVDFSSKTFSLLLSDFIILNSQRKVCPLGFSLLLLDYCLEGWGILNFIVWHKEEMIWVNLLLWKVESFLTSSFLSSNFSTTLLIFSNSDLLSELFSSG